MCFLVSPLLLGFNNTLVSWLFNAPEVSITLQPPVGKSQLFRCRWGDYVRTWGPGVAVFNQGNWYEMLNRCFKVFQVLDMESMYTGSWNVFNCVDYLTVFRTLSFERTLANMQFVSKLPRLDHAGLALGSQMRTVGLSVIHCIRMYKIFQDK